MRRTLRKKGISLLSPFGEILLYTCPSSPLFLYTHTRTTKTKTKTTISTSACIYIEVRQNAKRGSFFAFGLLKESANKDSAPREEEEKSHATELMEKNPYSSQQERVPFSLFFHLKP